MPLYIQTEMFPFAGERYGVRWYVVRQRLNDPQRQKQPRYKYLLESADGTQLFASTARFHRPESAAQAAVRDILHIEGQNASRDPGRPRLALIQ